MRLYLHVVDATLVGDTHAAHIESWINLPRSYARAGKAFVTVTRRVEIDLVERAPGLRRVFAVSDYRALAEAKLILTSIERRERKRV